MVSPRSSLFLGLKSVGRGTAGGVGVSFCFSFPRAARNRLGKVFLVKLKLKDTFCLPCSSRLTLVLVPLGKKRLEATPLNTGPLIKPALGTVSGLPCGRKRRCSWRNWILRGLNSVLQRLLSPGEFFIMIKEKFIPSVCLHCPALS